MKRSRGGLNTAFVNFKKSQWSNLGYKGSGSNAIFKSIDPA
jgi:hypothetical protein